MNFMNQLPNTVINMPLIDTREGLLQVGGY